MKNLIWGLVVLVAAAFLIGCGLDDAGLEVQSGLVTDNGNCESRRGDAVRISLNYENGMIGENVKILYRWNGGEWVVHDEHASGSTTITGKSGRYEIKAQMQNHVLESAYVIVPNDADCAILTQALQFNFSEATCFETVPITVALVRPAEKEGVMVGVQLPNNSLENRPCNPQVCTFTMSPSNPGVYEVKFYGFAEEKRITVVNGHIRHLHSTVELLIAVNNRKHHVVTEAVNNLTVRIPFRAGENGCYQVFYDEIVAESLPGTLAGNGTWSIKEETPIHVLDATSGECSQASVSQEVKFNVDIPSGTKAGDIRVEYWNNGGWQTAQCEVSDFYTCTASYMNPLRADRYHVRTMVKNEEHIGTLISLDSKCIRFD